MSRHPFGWDLPPGVTQRHIDESAGCCPYHDSGGLTRNSCGGDEFEPDWYTIELLKMAFRIAPQAIDHMPPILLDCLISIAEAMEDFDNEQLQQIHAYEDEQSLAYFNRYIAGDR